jgi:hypothetical protein
MDRGFLVLFGGALKPPMPAKKLPWLCGGAADGATSAAEPEIENAPGPADRTEFRRRPTAKPVSGKRSSVRRQAYREVRGRTV